MTLDQVLDHESRTCKHCGAQFCTRQYDDREICRACEKVAVEKSKLGK